LGNLFEAASIPEPKPGFPIGSKGMTEEEVAIFCLVSPASKPQVKFGSFLHLKTLYKGDYATINILPQAAKYLLITSKLGKRIAEQTVCSNTDLKCQIRDYS
jgi:hypothetical protein